jgi:hypothetical protein
MTPAERAMLVAREIAERCDSVTDPYIHAIVAKAIYDAQEAVRKLNQDVRAACLAERERVVHAIWQNERVIQATLEYLQERLD